jgi:hypothetical protein
LFAYFEEEWIRRSEGCGFTLADQPTQQTAKETTQPDADQEIGQWFHVMAEKRRRATLLPFKWALQ